MINFDRKLPDWIDSFIKYTENTEPPLMFRKWTAISVIAAALQRKCRIEWGTSLTFYPNMYIVLVGPTATGKGTAMSPGLDILEDLKHVKIAANSTTHQALIHRLKETNYSDPDLDSGEIQMHSSMTIFSKEFTVFLGYGNKEMMSILCDWYDCDRHWSYETISRKVEELVGVWVNLYGGTTPELIQSSMPIDAIGGGLSGRIIYIFEEKKGKLVTLPMQTDLDRELYQHLLNDLEKIYMLSGKFKYSDDFMREWDSWCRYADTNPPFKNSKFDGYLGRRRAHIMKLSMIMCVSRQKKEDQMTLDVEDFERAVSTLEEAEVKMQLVFRGVGKSDLSSLMSKSTMFFVDSIVDEIPYQQYAQHFQSDMDKNVMERILKTLEAVGLIKIIHRAQSEPILKIVDRGAAKNY